MIGADFQTIIDLWTHKDTLTDATGNFVTMHKMRLPHGVHITTGSANVFGVKSYPRRTKQFPLKLCTQI
jgi:hypothetical protein